MNNIDVDPVESNTGYSTNALFSTVVSFELLTSGRISLFQSFPNVMTLRSPQNRHLFQLLFIHCSKISYSRIISAGLGTGNSHW